MRISALVTTYRRFNKCCRAIDAILGQMHPVDEIIVVDNGSPESDYDGLHEKYASAAVPVNVVRLSRGTHTQPPFNSGKVEIDVASRDTTNVALGLARGDWFALCHDDDEWMPHRIQMQVQALREVPNCRLIGSQILNRREDGAVLGVHHDCYGVHGLLVGENVADVTDCLNRFNPLAVSSLLVARDVVDVVGGWQHWVPDDIGRYMRSLAASDWDFYRRATAVTRLMRVCEPLVWYEIGNVKHEGHMSYA